MMLLYSSMQKYAVAFEFFSALSAILFHLSWKPWERCPCVLWAFDVWMLLHPHRYSNPSVGLIWFQSIPHFVRIFRWIVIWSPFIPFQVEEMDDAVLRADATKIHGTPQAYTATTSLVCSVSRFTVLASVQKLTLLPPFFPLKHDFWFSLDLRFDCSLCLLCFLLLFPLRRLVRNYLCAFLEWHNSIII